MLVLGLKNDDFKGKSICNLPDKSFFIKILLFFHSKNSTKFILVAPLRRLSLLALRTMNHFLQISRLKR
jgi:hypothetical protein